MAGQTGSVAFLLLRMMKDLIYPSFQSNIGITFSKEISGIIAQLKIDYRDIVRKYFMNRTAFYALLLLIRFTTWLGRPGVKQNKNRLFSGHVRYQGGGVDPPPAKK